MPAGAAARTSEPSDERRWASVLFADLAGFTRRSEGMDHEEVKALAGSVTQLVARAVEEHGGTVVNVMGDGVMALFGAPVAHEDDAERAVRAALAMEREVAAMPGGLHLHIGINTGPVMAGASGPDRRYTAIGDTVNTAARVMAAAGPSEVLVGRETYLVTKEAVTYEPRPAISAKGKYEPVEVWSVRSVSELPRERPLGSTPFVGRGAELRLLEHVLTRTIGEGHPHLVTLVGEAGVGKTRLLAEFEARVGEAAQVVRGRCMPYGRGLGYWALARVVRQLAIAGDEEQAESVRERLRRSVEMVLGGDTVMDRRHLELICGVEMANSGSAQLADPRAMHATIRRYLEAHSRRRPLLVVIEDIHWADPPLLDALEFIAGRAADAPLLVLTTARNELSETRPGWGGGIRAFTSLPLEALDPESFRVLCERLSADLNLSTPDADRLRRNADGNPLFAEQLAAVMSERGDQAVPATIKALVGARIDTLGPRERSTLQLAAVLGLTFSDAALEAIGASTADAESLILKGFLREVPEALGRRSIAYGYRHALFRDVAYETLPRAERRRLHGVAGAWLEAAAGDGAEEYLTYLAEHALEAGQSERALGFLDRAAARASRVAAHREAAELLARAIALAEELSLPGPLVDLTMRRGKSFCRVGAWVDAVEPLERAIAMLPEDRVADRVIVEAELALAHNWLAHGEPLKVHAQRALSLAEGSGRADLIAIANGAVAVAHSSDGHVDEIIKAAELAAAEAPHLQHALIASALDIGTLGLYWRGRAAETIVSAHRAFDFSVDIGDSQNAVRALSHLGLALADAGRYGDAIAAFERADSYARGHGVDTFRARSLAMWGGVLLQLGEFEAAEAKAAEAMELADASSFPPAGASSRIDLVYNFVGRRDVGAAERLMAQVADAIEKAHGTHGWLWRLRFDQARAEVAALRGQPAEVLRWTDSADERNRVPRRAKYSALAASARARALDGLGRRPEAIDEARRAVELARSIGAPSLLLAVAPTLAALDPSEALAIEVTHTQAAIASSLPPDLATRYRARTAS